MASLLRVDALTSLSLSGGQLLVFSYHIMQRSSTVYIVITLFVTKFNVSVIKVNRGIATQVPDESCIQVNIGFELSQVLVLLMCTGPMCIDLNLGY
jgi:hypothetical protein